MTEKQEQRQGLLLTRVFDAPRELVFQVWTNPEHFGKWWGPKGFSLEVVQMDVRPGGMFLGCQKSPDGSMAMWGKFVYQEVNAPEKLVYVQSFSDEKGNTIRAPFNPNWPLEIINILTLEPSGDKTVLTLQGGPLNPTEEEQAAFDAMAPMVQQGFGGTFDQLADYLASQR
ncbi:SRPBCC family protein [Paenibacillus flagellatus]|uniref:Polyketide cyclase n=1 Tax=Paenibacillus flagellatus TaxID=2211139 RepID=A0A2V5K0Z0_9BACL|nr:SRPBCC domain-containing protein [Paenibacillus flagellatus]PYI52845.1 polyketide cyclase [Paenibacillus flagellatus]